MRSLALALLCAAIIFTPAPSQAQTPTPSEPPVAIHVDLAQSLGPYHPIYRFFGYDEINYTTGKYGHQLLPQLHDLSPGPVYIRAHHLFTSGDGVPTLKWSSTNIFTLDAAGHPVYNYTIIDQIFDEYRRAGVRPYVELGFMPKALASGAQPYYEPYPHTISGSVQSPPSSYTLWADLVFHFTQHLVQRYGAAQVSTWYFEVWNEPDISYWHGTPQQYFKLYDYSVAAVRRALPTARVGGPASTGPGGSRAIRFLQSFLNHCANDKSAATGGPIPLDFISFHPKGNARFIPATATQPAHVRMGLANELRAADNGFRVVAASTRFHNLPIILSEADPEGCAACSAKEKPANGYRNSPLYPTYTAAAMKALLDLAAQDKVNLAAMTTWAFEFEDKPYFEGFRTLATNGIDKPILNVFRMAGLFAGDRVFTSSSAAVSADGIRDNGVHALPEESTPATPAEFHAQPACDVDAFATRATHQASIMLWNYSDDDLPAPSAPVTVTVTGIPAGVHRVLVEQFRIDDTHSNAFTLWKSMGSPQSPAPAQYAALQAAGQLQLLTSPQWLDVTPNPSAPNSTPGTLTLQTTLPRPSTALLHLRW